jgi:dihydrodipicolinate reductase
MLPEGLTHVGSWVEDTFDRCFQLMECDDPRLFQQWTLHWEDLVAFEIVHVVSSTEALAVPTDVLIDYTAPEVVKEHILPALDQGVRVVVGTSGLTASDYSDIEQ